MAVFFYNRIYINLPIFSILISVFTNNFAALQYLQNLMRNISNEINNKIKNTIYSKCTST